MNFAEYALNATTDVLILTRNPYLAMCTLRGAAMRLLKDEEGHTFTYEGLEHPHTPETTAERAILNVRAGKLTAHTITLLRSEGADCCTCATCGNRH